jgi:hypothetical protein
MGVPSNGETAAPPSGKAYIAARTICSELGAQQPVDFGPDSHIPFIGLHHLAVGTATGYPLSAGKRRLPVRRLTVQALRNTRLPRRLRMDGALPLDLLARYRMRSARHIRRQGAFRAPAVLKGQKRFGRR